MVVPAGATGKVYVPAANAAAVNEIGSGRPILAGRAPGVRLIGVEEDRVVYEVGSGRYQFRVKR